MVDEQRSVRSNQQQTARVNENVTTPETTTTEEGDLSVFVGPVGENQVTVLGEVPPAAAQQVGRSVARRP